MKHSSIFIFLVLILHLLVSSTGRQVYIVYFGKHSGEKTHEEIEEHHHSYLFSLRESKEEAKDSLLYSYKNSINGFAAMLSPDEAKKLSELNEVITVFPSKAKTLHTTRSWEFLGLGKGDEGNISDKNDLWVRAGYGKQVIVGLLDTGIWPEAESFSDRGMSPIPKSWKGICDHGDSFNSSHCNRKIIGAKYYLKGFEKQYGPINQKTTYKSPRDENGHGTHTSSTLGGGFVNAEINGGFAQGRASGGAPLAHIAMYKVCWPYGTGTKCLDEDIMAAIDDAIGDGVDILSLSLGDDRKLDYAKDTITIGSLHAVEKNIVVACSAGNFGWPSAVMNIAPWVITVAASSIDRAFPAPLLLGNGENIPGETLTTSKLEEKMYPLVSSKDIAQNLTTKNSGDCLSGALSPQKTKGKIVLCTSGFVSQIEAGEEVKRVGGAGIVWGQSVDGLELELTLNGDVLPATTIGYIGVGKILEYMNSTQNPMAYINHGTTVLNVKPAPVMASFSGRGPNRVTPDILKPDITGPGVKILAAWTGASPSPERYTIESGTSMSCPHVAAVAVLIKSIHPTWSSAAIRSAIMTTAVQTDNMNMSITNIDGTKADPFQYGSGHIQPTKAADPGLVYDASYTDYLLFLCYESSIAFDKSFKCPPNPPSSNNLNYPSLSISKLNGTVTIERVVTNVGENKASYVSQVEAPKGVSVKVTPSRLDFHRVGEKQRFTITIETEKSRTKKNIENGEDGGGYVFGWYSWSDGFHFVRSPIAINLA